MGVIGIILRGAAERHRGRRGLPQGGSAILLRGSSSAYESNAALVRVMRGALEAAA